MTHMRKRSALERARDARARVYYLERIRLEGPDKVAVVCLRIDDGVCDPSDVVGICWHCFNPVFHRPYICPDSPLVCERCASILELTMSEEQQALMQASLDAQARWIDKTGKNPEKSA